MTTQLQIYNGALMHLGEVRLASLTEKRKPRSVLDENWNDDFLKLVLGEGSWNFAIQTSKFSYESGLETGFGMEYVTSQPSDFVKTVAISGEETFQEPLYPYFDEQEKWYSNYRDIYVKYVSLHPLIGGNLAKWPPHFTQYVKAELAVSVCMPITQDKVRWRELKAERTEALNNARAKDAIAEAPKFMPRGRWALARGGRVQG